MSTTDITQAPALPCAPPSLLQHCNEVFISKQATALISVPACLLQQCSEAIRRELFQERVAVLKAQADEAAAAQKALQEKEFRWVQADHLSLPPESHSAAAGCPTRGHP